jgi:hypothetical protein
LLSDVGAADPFWALGERTPAAAAAVDHGLHGLKVRTPWMMMEMEARSICGRPEVIRVLAREQE